MLAILNNTLSKFQLVFLAIIRYLSFVTAAVNADISEANCASEGSVKLATVASKISLIMLIITVVYSAAAGYFKIEDKRYYYAVIAVNGIWMAALIFLFKLDSDCGALVNLARVCLLAPILCFIETAVLLYFEIQSTLRFTLTRGQLLWTVLSFIDGFSCGSFDNYFGVVGILQIITFAWAVTNSFTKDLLRSKFGKSFSNQGVIVALVLQGLFYLIGVMFYLATTTQPATLQCRSKYYGLATYSKSEFVQISALVLGLIWGRQMEGETQVAPE